MCKNSVDMYYYVFRIDFIWENHGDCKNDTTSLIISQTYLHIVANVQSLRNNRYEKTFFL